MFDLNCLNNELNTYNKQNVSILKITKSKILFRWNSVSNDELLQQQVDIFDRHYSTSSQYLMPSILNAGTHNNIMMVNPARGNIKSYHFREIFIFDIFVSITLTCIFL